MGFAKTKDMCAQLHDPLRLSTTRLTRKGSGVSSTPTKSSPTVGVVDEEPVGSDGEIDDLWPEG